MHSSGVSLEVHKQIYGVTFLSSSSCFSCTFQFIGPPPSQSSEGKARLLVPHSATCFLNCVPKSGAKQHEGRVRKKQPGFTTPCWDSSSSDQRGRFPFLGFRHLKVPLWPLALPPPLPWDAWELEHEKTEGK